jgi:hypothetical protein
LNVSFEEKAPSVLQTVVVAVHIKRSGLFWVVGYRGGAFCCCMIRLCLHALAWCCCGVGYSCAGLERV